MTRLTPAQAAAAMRAQGRTEAEIAEALGETPTAEYPWAQDIADNLRPCKEYDAAAVLSKTLDAEAEAYEQMHDTLHELYEAEKLTELYRASEFGGPAALAWWLNKQHAEGYDLHSTTAYGNPTEYGVFVVVRKREPVAPAASDVNRALLLDCTESLIDLLDRANKQQQPTPEEMVLARKAIADAMKVVEALR